MRTVDFHLHTVDSDGIHPFRDLLTYLKEGQVTDCSVTDHDTALNVVKYERMAKKEGIRLIKGVEISTTAKRYGFPDMHILGYGFTNLGLMELELNKYKEKNETIVLSVIDKLIEQGINIDREDVRLAQRGLYLTKRDLARHMVECGFAQDHKEVYDKYIGRGLPAYIPIKKMSVLKAINLIKKCGGVAVLAHPSKMNEPTRYVEIFEFLKENGLDGVETITPCHSPEEIAKFNALAKHYELVTTCGTDFHSIEKDRIPGCQVDDEFLYPFYELLGLV